ncbi:hypothetical protein FGO68_gene8170 [Halteria grandinella]|uniref:Uncharacterized protein n=1 Tax=Halteria grandinella TaxID=5974 RepID=A0A8J8P923_HALGN|nr:hypothetical protein FGO68_gene8170 [Halteria grandinella]
MCFSITLSRQIVSNYYQSYRSFTHKERQGLNFLSQISLCPQIVQSSHLPASWIANESRCSLSLIFDQLLCSNRRQAGLHRSVY